MNIQFATYYRLLVLSCCFLVFSFSFGIANSRIKRNSPKALDTQISGTINTYTPVLSIEGGCSPKITVENSIGLNVNDKVLIIQMQGATIDTTNTSQYGTITSYNDAGNYEFARIRSISGQTIFLSDTLLRTYTISGKVQLVRIPEYQNVTVSNSLTGLPWNGSRGGIIVLSASETLTLNGAIIASELGFRGANPVNSLDFPTYQVSDYVGINSKPGYCAPKGEGIAKYGVTPYTNGKGAPANGGGGGNNHNAGGAGGGSFGAGGNGGYGWKPIYTGDNTLSQGLGGYALSNNFNKIFLGGGGGAGHTNENDPSIGGNGGGIIIIVANQIISNNQLIASDGANGRDAAPDGGAGAGAGGTILIVSSKFQGTLSINCKGNKGGNNTWRTAGQAPGGGGGGGGVLFSQSSTPANTTISNIGGQPGIMTANGQSFGASAGANGGILYDIVIPENKSTNSIPPANAGIDKTICPGATVQLGASSETGCTYSWFPPIDLDNPNISNPNCSPKQSRVYILKQITPLGCISFDSVLVTIDGIVAEISPESPLCCLNSSIQLYGSTGGESYSWSPVTELSNPDIYNPICNPTQTRQYILKVVSPAGCTTFDTVIVKVDTVKAKIVPVQPICAGASVQLSASGGEAYFWSPTKGLDSPTIANPIASPQTKTEYKVVVSRGNCLDSAFVTVDIIHPIANAGQDKTICSGASTQIGTQAVAGNTYSWVPSTGLDDPSAANPFASPAATTRYILTVSQNDCVAFDTVVITVGNLKAAVSNDIDICKGEKVQLSASGGSDYLWEPSKGLDDPKISNPIASPLQTTTYKVTVSSGKCIDSAFVTVNVKPSSTANAGDDKIICPGASIQIGSEPEPGYLYSWLPKTGLDDTSKSNPTATPNKTTQYILSVSNSTGGCISYDTVNISVGNIVAKVTSDTAVCSGSSIQLTASGGNDYNWTPITGLSNPNIANPVASPNSTITYRVLVSSGNCFDSSFVKITVLSAPTANAGEDKTLCSNSSVQLGTPAEVGNTYSWQPNIGLDDATIAMPTASPTQTTKYFLTVRNGSTCFGFDSVVVNIGNIKALVADDTLELCVGSSTRLSASGGNNYLWTPSIGLDDPNIPNPTVTLTSSMTYRVLVSTGTCIDSAFVAVLIASQPIADAGVDKFICIGEKETIGVTSIPENTYSWNPTAGLLNPNVSQTIASPNSTTPYILTVTNSEGCISIDTVLVSITSINERIFSLNPQTLTMIPGKPFQTSLHIPNDVISWVVHLSYDDLTIKYDTILQISTVKLTEPPIEKNRQLLLRGAGENGDILIRFNSYLPHTPDTLLSVGLTIDSANVESCIGAVAHGNILQLGEYCAKAIRSVSSTGKNYFLLNKENAMNFGVGLSGKVRLKLYDYTGELKQVLVDDVLQAGEYSIDFDLPIGLYFCHLSSGMFNDIQKVLIMK